MGSGADWRKLPERYPPYQACYRRFQKWIRSGRLEAALKLLARHLHQRGRLNLNEASWMLLSRAGKRGLGVGPTRRGNGTEIVTIASGDSLPLAASVQSASPAGCLPVEEVLAGSFLDELPARLVGDKGQGSERLDNEFQAEYGIK